VGVHARHCTQNEEGPVERDPLTGVPVVVVTDRQRRPLTDAPDGCPFCPGGLEAPDGYDVRSFVNRWPPLADDRCEVVLYTPDHDASFWSLGVDGARRVIDLWTERSLALGRRADVASVLVFENRGAEVGATVAHPHGQIYAFDAVPDLIGREFAGPHCSLCAAVPDEQVVTARGDWRAWVPTAAAWPYELRMGPGAHVPDLAAAMPSADEFAGVLVDALARLDQLFDAPMPYMLWIHQRPTDGGPWPAAHLHVHVAPVLRGPATPRFVAAGELGSGVFFNPVDPVAAASALRSLPGPAGGAPRGYRPE
jgi:UDPglucose--hexose-1-phosphate uridylyltransferase